MIQFKTKNSEYRVMCLHGKFHVTKIDSLAPDGSKIGVGSVHVCKRMRLEIGDRANFDGMSTSEVVSIQDSPPVREGIC